MLNFIIGLIAGIGVATVACLVWLKMKKSVAEAPQEIENTFINPAVEVKNENIQKYPEALGDGFLLPGTLIFF